MGGFLGTDSTFQGEIDAFVAAAQAGDEEALDQMLQSGASCLNARASIGGMAGKGEAGGRTPLVAAIYADQVAMAHKLLGISGIWIDQGDSHGVTALMAACARGHLDIVQRLLSQQTGGGRSGSGADTSTGGGGGSVAKAKLAMMQKKDQENWWTPLHHATAYDQREVVSFLLKAEVNCNAPDKYGQTPLHLASHEGYGEIVTMLIRYGRNIDVNARDMDENTPMDLAADDETHGIFVKHGGSHGAENTEDIA